MKSWEDSGGFWRKRRGAGTVVEANWEVVACSLLASVKIAEANDYKLQKKVSLSKNYFFRFPRLRMGFKVDF